jgi:predicted HicB family RNase H-like nuclease
VPGQRGDQTKIAHKGYTGVIKFDPSINAFHGRVVGLQDVVNFEGRSLDELRREMAESLEDVLEFCVEAGKDPGRPCRGEFLVRTSPELHRAAATEAKASGMSLNAWVGAAMAQGVREPHAQVKPDQPSHSRPEGTRTRKGHSRSPGGASGAV